MLFCSLLFVVELSVLTPLLLFSLGSGFLTAVLAKRKKLNSYTWFCLGFCLSLWAVPCVFIVAFFKSEAKSQAKSLTQETDKVLKTLLNHNESIVFQQSASYLGGIKGHPEKTNYTGQVLILDTSFAFYDHNITWKVEYARVVKVELGLFQMGETRALWASGDVGRQLQQTKNTLELYCLDSNGTERCAKFQIHGAATIQGEAVNAQQVLNHLLEFKDQFIGKSADNITSSFSKLEKLKKLKDEGVISESEFNDKKAKFLEEI